MSETMQPMVMLLLLTTLTLCGNCMKTVFPDIYFLKLNVLVAVLMAIYVYLAPWTVIKLQMLLIISQLNRLCGGLVDDLVLETFYREHVFYACRCWLILSWHSQCRK